MDDIRKMEAETQKELDEVSVYDIIAQFVGQNREII